MELIIFASAEMKNHVITLNRIIINKRVEIDKANDLIVIKCRRMAKTEDFWYWTADCRMAEIPFHLSVRTYLSEI